LAPQIVGLIYFICALALLQGVASLLQGIASVRHIRRYRPQSSWQPRVVVFCPCRGVDAGFRENVRSILDQNYPHYRAVFIVDSLEDPAARLLAEMNATVLAAGDAVDCGQKVHNLIYGVENAAGDSEVFVFCDVDARFSREWLKQLIAPLDRSEVAVSTGYRWYAAEGGGLPDLLRSSWNASVVTTLSERGRNFAWGGSMALRRVVFEEIGVRKAWNGAVSDDYAVTHAAVRSGKRIVFVPQCLIPSYGSCTWSELLEFSTRQILITRVYDPSSWRLALVTQSIFNVAFWAGLLLPWPFWLVTPALWILAGIKSYLRYQAVATVLPEGALSKYRSSYILLAPLTALLFEYNLLRSAVSRSITWRQIRYKLISPNRTEVYRGGAAS
jgi:cellulose synthase/poly-beta-1,6-N-acetylglucosamine synthase-like glycosyltransferase